jgi:hypothetical protein
MQTAEVPHGFVWNKSSKPGEILPTPATAVEPQGTHTILKNLWYNNCRSAPACSLTFAISVFSQWRPLVHCLALTHLLHVAASCTVDLVSPPTIQVKLKEAN